MDDKKIEKSKLKIAIYNFENDTQKIKIPKNEIIRMVATFLLAIGISGVVYATRTVVYNKIWKEPEKKSKDIIIQMG